MAGTTVGTNLGYTFGPFTESIVPVKSEPPPASIATIASQHLTADLNYFQHLTVTSPHVAQIVSDYTQRHPLGFLATQGPISASMATEAVRQDVLTMLQVMNTEWGNSAAIEADITLLRAQPIEELMAAIPTLVRGMYRAMTVKTIAQLQHMDSEIQKGLWGSSTRNESMMGEQFKRATDELNHVLVLIDQGNIDDALFQYSATMSNAGTQIRCFQGAYAESERGKFAAQIGITIVAGIAAAYTGGISLAAMAGGTEAAATGVGVGLGAYAASTAISGTTFVLSDRLLQKQIFDTPLLRKDNILGNTIDWGGDILTTSALFGWMQGVGMAAKALPAFSGELAPVLNSFKNFGMEYTGLTAFNVATSDEPQQVFTKDFHQKNLAFLLGVKIGNAGAALSFDTVSIALRNNSNFMRTEVQYIAGVLRDMRGNPNTPILERVPLAAIIWGNMNLSFFSAKLISTLLRDYLPPEIIDHSANLLQHLDVTTLGHDISTLTAWKNTNLLFLGATTFFAGIDGFMPRAWTFRKKGLDPWVNQKLSVLQNFGPTVYNGIHDLLTHIHPSLPDYSLELMLRGSIGCTEMAGIRNPKVFAPVTKFKEALKSKPVERTLTKHLGDWAPEKVVKSIARLPDGILNFMGQVTPSKKGVLIGFGIDIAANSLLDVSGALLFSNNANLYKLLVPGFLISTFIGYANTRISQSQGIFSQSQKLLHRAKLGILKTAFYRGPYTSGITTDGFNLFIQFAYGVWAIAHADKITQPRPLHMYSPEVLERVEHARQNGKLTVATLDSGLGGLSIFANAYTQLQNGPFQQVKDIFLNVQTGPELGFNSYPTMVEKARQLDHVLEEVTAQLQPDLVVLACHTMSLIYPHTEFARRHGPQLPAVLDVMTVSTELMVNAISKAPESQLVLMSTPAVAESGVYQERLKGRHVREDRIFSEPSPDLTTNIQNDPSGGTTIALVNEHVDRVWQTLDQVGRLTDPVLVALNCSQYALIAGTIQDAFTRRGLNARIINPAHEMLSNLFDAPKVKTQTVSAEAYIYSEVPIQRQLGAYLASISKTAAEAVKTLQPSNGMAIPHPVAVAH